MKTNHQVHKKLEQNKLALRKLEFNKLFSKKNIPVWKDLVVVSTLVMTGLVACGKKDSGSPAPVATPPPVVNPYAANCPTCFAGGAVILTGVQTSSTNGNFQARLDLVASQQTGTTYTQPYQQYPNQQYPYQQYPNQPYQQYPNQPYPNQQYGVNDFNNPRIAYTYTGTVMLAGKLNIASANDFMVCNATPGEYDLRTVEIGQYAAGRLGAMRLEANSPSGGRMVIRVASGTFYNSVTGLDKTSGDNRVGLDMYLESVNGQPCNTLSTY